MTPTRDRRLRPGSRPLPVPATTLPVAADRGQSSVELVAMLPLLVAVVLSVAQLLAAGVAHELAGHAAENGAIALAEGEDAADAVREALPGWARDRVRVRVHGRRVQVHLTPVTPFPGVGEALAADSRADAGPATAGPAHGPAGGQAPSATEFGAPTEATRDDPGTIRGSR